MNAFSKNTSKLLLVIFASIIFILTILYANSIVHRIEHEEREKALLWVTAIRKKAALIRYTEDLFEKLEDEEKKKGELWAKGVKKLISTTNMNEDLTFVFDVVKNNETVPVILTDEKGNVISSRNLDPAKSNDPNYLAFQIGLMKRAHPPIEINILNKTKNKLYYKESQLFTDLKLILDDLIRTFITEEVINTASVPVIYTDQTQKNIIHFGNIIFKTTNHEKELIEILQHMKKQHQPIRLDMPNGRVDYIFYQQSSLLKQLKLFPYIQIIAIIAFFLVSYVLFSSSRKSEQNRVWVGMSKETAHQLGTPISSLMAWIEVLKMRYPEDEASDEMMKDISRLETITERFSKIGSKPQMEIDFLIQNLEHSITYLKDRVSRKVNFNYQFENQHELLVEINKALFDWAIENLIKNAVDAMEGVGTINIEVSHTNELAIIEISDTGKGVAKKNWNKIFEPGFTSKKRGWGLGLTLVKRIIDEYHKGKIIVKRSEINQGTTFRITLPLKKINKI